MLKKNRSAKLDGVWVTSLLWIVKGERFWIVDVHRDGKRFIVRAEGKLTAFVELESAISGSRRIALTRWRDFCQARRR